MVFPSVPPRAAQSSGVQKKINCVVLVRTNQKNEIGLLFIICYGLEHFLKKNQGEILIYYYLVTLILLLLQQISISSYV